MNLFKALILAFMFLLISLSASAKSFDVSPPFNVSDNGLTIEGSYGSGMLALSFSSDDGEPLNAGFFILNASGKQVAEKRLLDSPKITESISLSYGDYSIVVSNAKTGYQEPKINLSIPSPETAAAGESTFYSTSNPLAFLSGNIPLILVIILAVLLVIFFIGKSRDKKLKGITGEHPMRDSSPGESLSQGGEVQ